MYTSGFLTSFERAYLRDYINRRKADGLSVRRANALLALDKGWSFEDVCDFLEISCSALRGWLKAYEKQGMDFLEMRNYSKREGHLSFTQEQALSTYLRDHPKRTSDEIRAHISRDYGKDYSRSGCIKLMTRLGTLPMRCVSGLIFMQLCVLRILMCPSLNAKA